VSLQRFYVCPNCRTELEVPADLAGHLVSCSVCQRPFRIAFPGADPAEPWWQGSVVYPGMPPAVGQESGLLAYARWQQGIKSNVLYVVLLVAFLSGLGGLWFLALLLFIGTD
jgi:hypothetical protein